MNWPTPLHLYLDEREDLDSAIRDVLLRGLYILGPEVAEFERQFAEYVGTSDAVGVANGTDALAVALRALDIGDGSHVATVSHTAVATVAAIMATGAQPVFVDVNTSMTMCPESLARVALRYPIDAIVPVHLYGQPADMRAIGSIAREIGALVVEDCSQAHGAMIDGQHVGTFGDAGAFSCYPTKNLGALGDAGIVACSQPVGERIRSLRQYGWQERYVSHELGVNSRLDTLQAAVLLRRLPRLDSYNQRRREVAARYAALLDGAVLVPEPADREFHVYHQFVIRTEHRDALLELFLSEGVPVGLLYPLPVHLQPAYLDRIAMDPFGLVNTERIARELLCLPIHPLLPPAAADHVAKLLLRCVDAIAGRG